MQLDNFKVYDHLCSVDQFLAVLDLAQRLHLVRRTLMFERQGTALCALSADISADNTTVSCSRPHHAKKVLESEVRTSPVELNLCFF